MSNMKDLLGDMEFEKFEEMRKSVLNNMTSTDWEQVTGKDDDASRMYRYWLEIGGKELTKKWVDDRGGFITEEDFDECLLYIVTSFISWLRSFE